MSILIAYLDDDRTKRIHISDYKPDEHKGKVTCGDGHPVVGKQGLKVVWHYAHVSAADNECSRSMGPWHHWWQDRVEPDFLEIIIKRNEKKHIADMINGDDVVVEFQKSVVPQSTIIEREQFYDNMIWVFCCVEHRMKEVCQIGRYMKLMMLGGSKYFLDAKKRSFLDFDRRGLLEVLKVTNASKSKPEIYVRIWTMTEFDELYMDGCLNDGALTRIDRQPYIFDDSGETFENVEKNLKRNQK